MSTNGLGRGAMTGSSTTTSAESALWGPYRDVMSTARPHRPLDARAAADRAPPPTGHERGAVPVPSGPHSLFRSPLVPTSPSGGTHEQYPTYTTAGGSPLFSPSPIYPQLSSTYFPSSFQYPGTGSPVALGLSGPYHNVDSYAELLVHMQRGGPRLAMGSHQLHLSPQSMSTLRTDSQSHRHSAASQPSVPMAGHAERPSKPADQQQQTRFSSEPAQQLSLLAQSHRTTPQLTQTQTPRSLSSFSRVISAETGQYSSSQGLSRVPSSQSDIKYLGRQLQTGHELLPKKARSSSPTGSGWARSVQAASHSVTSTTSTSLAAARSAERWSPAAQQPHYPPHFMRGSIIQLATGALKRVEDLRTEDFVNSADISPDLKIDSSQVAYIEENTEGGTAVLGFAVGEQKLRVTVEATVEHPFFVFGRGWSSCSPHRTMQRYGLHCMKLVVGDICISLTQKRLSAATEVAVSSRVKVNGNGSESVSRSPSREQRHPAQQPASPAQHAPAHSSTGSKQGSAHSLSQQIGEECRPASGSKPAADCSAIAGGAASTPPPAPDSPPHAAPCPRTPSPAAAPPQHPAALDIASNHHKA